MQLAPRICAAFAVVACVVRAAHAADDIRFGRDVLPILSDNCFKCHGPDEKQRQAELRLDVEESAKAEREGGIVVSPGKPAESKLIARILSADPAEQMPPPDSNKQLSPRQIEVLTQWIEQGAKWGQHWSLEPLVRPEVPSLGATGSLSTRAPDAESSRADKPPVAPANPIDSFILHRLTAEGLQPSPVASKETLIRRLSLDLTGLPPTLADIDAFLADESPTAYEKLVDRLLASPRFGERMAWPWLDAARYADSNGYQGDNDRTMWPWRDWVVRAFNDNLPFNEFSIWQLAGDQLPQATNDQRLATGFCRNHMINGEGGRIPEENRVEYVMDMSETMSTVWLGLTVGCCRCHDHKFDPLSQRDYYSLFAFFNQTPVDGGGGNPQTPPLLTAKSADDERHLQQLEDAITARLTELEQAELVAFPRAEGKPASESDKAAALPDNVKAILARPAADRDAAQFADLEKHFAESQPNLAAAARQLKAAREARTNFEIALPKVMVMEDLAQPRKSFLLDRGLYNKPGEEVAAAVPHKLPPLPEGAAANRLGMARWLFSVEHPLTARVAANRLWQQFFGIGLVKTSEDFGVQGEFPSHPELLDWLACELRDKGWDIKHQVRLLVTNSTYRQSSQVSPELAARDPDNRLLARAPRYRWPSWMLRDQALSAAGLLSTRIGGSPVRPYQPEGVWEEASFGNKRYEPDHGEPLYRRSVYTFWRRIIAPTMFFDTASRQTCTVKQLRTNSPLHALATLNDVQYVEAARVLAESVMAASDSADDRIDRLFRVVISRKPSDEERQVLLDALTRLRQEYTANADAARQLLAAGESLRDERLDAAEHAALTALCLAVLNLDEALSKE